MVYQQLEHRLTNFFPTMHAWVCAQRHAPLEGQEGFLSPAQQTKQICLKYLRIQQKENMNSFFKY